MVDEPAADAFASVTATLRRIGRPVPSKDAWIAALPVRDRVTLLTHDEDFRAVESLSSVILPGAS